MDILLFRHGIAIDRAHPSCPPDPDRFLTDKGRGRTAAAARGLATLDIAPDLIVTSPYVRATQTAELAMEAFEYETKRLHTTEALLPEAEPEDLFDELVALGANAVLCCGHAPNLDLVLAYILGYAEEATALKKAGAAWLRLFGGPGHAELVALLPPKVLRALDGR